MEIQILSSISSCERVAAPHPFATCMEERRNSFHDRSSWSTFTEPFPGENSAFDREISIVGPTVFATKAGLKTISYTADRHNRQQVVQAFYANFLSDDVNHNQVLRNATSQSFHSTPPTGIRRALVAVCAKSATLHFSDGQSHDIPIPYRVQHIWPLSIGILLQSMREQGESNERPALYSLTHPLDNFRPVEVKIRSLEQTSRTPGMNEDSTGNFHEDIVTVLSSAKGPPFLATFDRTDKTHHIWEYQYEQNENGFRSVGNSIEIDQRVHARVASDPQITIRQLWSEPKDANMCCGRPAELFFVNTDHAEKYTIWFLSQDQSDLQERIDTMGQGHRRLTALRSEMSPSLPHGQLNLEIISMMQIVSAVPVMATRADHEDILILDPTGSLCLWTGFGDPLPCTLPLNFRKMLGGHQLENKGKRRRSVQEDMMDIAEDTMGYQGRPNLQSPSRTSRVVELSNPVYNRLTMKLSNGVIFRARFDCLPKSDIVVQCLDALSYALPPDLFEEFRHRFISFHFAPEFKWVGVRSHDEWTDFVITLLSFCHNRVTSSSASTELPPSRQENCLHWLNRRIAGTNKVRTMFEESLRTGRDKAFPEWKKNGNQELCSKSETLYHNYRTRPDLIDQLPVILIYLHIVYENCKLNCLHGPQQKELGSLLLQLANSLGWDDYRSLYLIDQIENVNPMLPNVGNPPCPAPPFQIFLAVLDILRRPSNPMSALEVLKYLPSNGTHDPADFVRKTSIYKIYGLFTSLCSAGPSELVIQMINQGFEKKDLTVLPIGLSLPLLQALDDCRASPPGDWISAAYALIGREDLVKQFGGSNSVQTAEKGSFSIPVASTDAAKIHDGTEMVLTEVTKLRFSKDRRVEEVQRLLQSARPSTLKVELDYNMGDEKVKADQQKHLQYISQKILALPLGRGAFTLGTAIPTPTEVHPIPELVVAARFPPLNSMVYIETPKTTPSPMDWPEFHNGVAAGLSLKPNWRDVNGSWIVFNTPTITEDGRRVLACKHAGFLFGLGLMGNLRNINLYDLIDFMNLKHELTAIGLLLGLAATHKGDQDMRHTRLCYSHIEPTDDLSGKPPGLEVKPAAILGVGILHMESLARLHTEKMLYLLQNIDEGSSHITESQRESCALAAGFALGMITLGRINSPQAAGIADIRLGDRILRLALGKGQSYTIVSATIALGLMFLKSNDHGIAAKLQLPQTTHVLNKIRPEILLLRTLAQNLIMWDFIEPTMEWAEGQVPQYIRDGKDGKNHAGDVDLLRQAYWNILAGASFAIGLRFAGSNHSIAFRTLLDITKNLIAAANTPATTFSERLGKTVVRGCVDVAITSLCLVASGSGNVQVLRILRKLSARSGTEISYGNHMATHMAIGFLMLGGGAYAFGTSNVAIAALVCALFPRYPLLPTENLPHLQAFRHLWALAVEPRCLVTRDVQTRELCCVPVVVKTFDVQVEGGLREFRMTTPCLLPSYRDIHSIRTESPRYWSNVLEISSNVKHRQILLTHRTMFVKKKIGHLSYMQDPRGSHTSSSFPHPVMSLDGSDSVDVFSAAPELSSFAQYLCKFGSYTKTARSSFLTTVLNECVKRDRCDVIYPYLWLERSLQKLWSITPTTIWNIRLILEFYEGSAMTKGQSEGAANNLLRGTQQPLLAPVFINQARAVLERFFRELERSDVAEAHGSFTDLLSEYLSARDYPTRLPGHMWAVCSAYLLYREWPGGKKVEWLKQSVEMTKGSSDCTLDNKAWELGMALRMKEIPQRTLVRLCAEYVHKA